MRRLIAVVSLATVINAAGAASQDPATQGSAYLGFSFGGQTIAARDFHYGLRLNYDTRFGPEARDNEPALRPTAPLVQFDFTRRGLDTARLNGLSLLKKAYTLKQTGEAPVEGEEAPAEEAPAEEAPPETSTDAPAEAEAPAEGAETPAADATAAAPAEAAPAEAAQEQGFFTRSWHGVKSFFGMGDKAATETAKTESKPADEPTAENPADVAQGTFMGYNVIDWATLAVGAVGVGLIASEVANGKESPDVKGGGSGSGGGGGGCPAGQTPNPLPGGPACIPVPFAGTGGSAAFATKANPEFQKWLDGGTGHMGDLEARPEPTN